MYKKSVGVLFALSLFANASYANDDIKYENMANQLSKQLQVSMKVVSNPELIKSNAKYIRSLYDALIKEGFTKEQAIQLVSATLSSKK